MSDQETHPETPVVQEGSPTVAAAATESPVARELLGRIEEELRESRKRGRRRVVSLVLLLLVVGVYTGWILSELRKADARAVAEAARGFVLTTLPDLKKSLRASLIDSAPEAIDFGKQAIAQTPRLLREYLDREVPASTQAVALIFEDELGMQLDVAVNGVIRLAEAYEKDTGRKPTLDELAQNLRVTYQGMMRTILDDTHAKYAAQIEQLNTQLTRLRDGRYLTQRERTHRELIEATLVVMDRYGITGPPAPAL